MVGEILPRDDGGVDEGGSEAEARLFGRVPE